MESDDQEIPVTQDGATVEVASAGGERAASSAGTTPRRRSRNGNGRRRGPASAPRESEERGKVGQQIYAEVNRIIAAEGISKQDAFARVGEAQGRQQGTVAANYYRVARTQGGAGVSGRGGRGPGSRGRGRGRRQTDGSAAAAISALKGALDELGRVIRAQDRRIARLQEENAQFGEIRTLIARTSGGGRRKARR